MAIKIRKVKKEKLAVVALALALIASMSYIFYENFLRQKQTDLDMAYVRGVNDGRIQLLDNILTQIQSTGVARLTIATENQIATLFLAPVTESNTTATK